jgi:hypothetical protein
MIQSPHVLRATEPDPTASKDASAETGSHTVCPLCGLSTEDPTRIYTHLQIGHKKSELAGFVLDR